MFLTELNFIAVTVRKICCYETIRENTSTFFHDFFLDRFTSGGMCLTVPSLSFSFYYRTETILTNDKSFNPRECSSH